jgi:hypothetical protein
VRVHGENPRARSRDLRRHLPAVLAVVAIVASAVLVGCDDEDPRAADDAVDYVALGDSFTATGLPVAEGECKRSTQNYPHLIAEADPEIRLVDVSCGGASTADMRHSQEFRGSVQPPQFDALDRTVDLVTVSLGGNDYDVYWNYLYRCVQLAATDPDGHPCRTADGGRIAGRMGSIRDNLTAVLEEVAERAPEARVIVVGYPRLLPDSGSCPRRVPVAKGDVDYVRDMHALLVRAQRDAAKAAGAEFVDVYTPSKGHDICSADPWVNDVTDGPRGSYNFHPMPAHQRAVAELVLQML